MKPRVENLWYLQNCFCFRYVLAGSKWTCCVSCDSLVLCYISKNCLLPILYHLYSTGKYIEQCTFHTFHFNRGLLDEHMLDEQLDFVRLICLLHQNQKHINYWRMIKYSIWRKWLNSSCCFN